MKVVDIAFAALAVFSAVMLTYKWLSLYGKTEYVINFYAALLTLSIVSLILRR